MSLGTSYPASAGSPRRYAPPQAQPPVAPPDSSSTPGGGYKGASGPGKGQTLGPGGPAPSRIDPTVPYSNGTAYPRSEPDNYFNQLIADFNAINRGQSDSLANQYTSAMGLGQGVYDNNVWYRQAQAGNDLARLGLQEGREVGLERERNNADRGFAGRGFEIDSRGNNLQRDMRYRANDSEAAGRGSITSFGYGQNERDILGQFDIAQDTTQLTFDKKMSDLDIDDKVIDSIASEFGIRKSDINNALKFGMTQLGLDWTQAVDRLNGDLASGDAILAQNAINFLTQVMSMPMQPPSMTDMFGSTSTPSTPPTPTPSTGVGGSGGSSGGRPITFR